MNLERLLAASCWLLASLFVFRVSCFVSRVSILQILIQRLLLEVIPEIKRQVFDDILENTFFEGTYGFVERAFGDHDLTFDGFIYVKE